MATKILEVSKVTPPPMSPIDMCLPLAFFDLIWLRFPPAQLLFFYETSFISEALVSRLKESLSLTLRDFFPLSGNLEWPSSMSNPVIHFKNGDGVFLTVAQSDADFCHLSSNKFRENKIFHSLVAELTSSDSQVSILAIKVTLFPNKGFCIGMTTHHAALDGALCSKFYKSWASISKYGETSNFSPESTPQFDRNPVREQYRHLEDIYIDHLLKEDVSNPRSLAFTKVESIPERIRGTFQISASDIKNLKKFVLEHEETNNDLALTTFTVALAYIVFCSAKARDGMQNKVGFDIVVDCRSRLEPPLSPNYAGNCIGFAGGDVDRDDLMKENGIIAVVNAVQKMRKNLNEGVLKEAEIWLDDLVTDNITIAGSIYMDMYGADFGWGKPKKADIASIDNSNAVSLVEGRDGVGWIELELNLSKNEMEKFAFVFAQGLNKLNLVTSAL